MQIEQFYFQLLISDLNIGIENCHVDLDLLKDIIQKLYETFSEAYQKFD